jgi:glycosyltransferase involved in cell wall biosynthesis
MVSSKRDRVGIILSSFEVSGGGLFALELIKSLSSDADCYILLADQNALLGSSKSTTFLDSQGLNILFLSQTNEDFDLIILTFWGTFELAHQSRIKSKNWVYFVQSLEDRFYANPKSMDKWGVVKALDTYRFNIPMITEANWIQENLLERDSRRTEVTLIQNGLTVPTEYLLRKFYPQENGVLQIIIEGHSAWFKGVKDALKGLELVGGIELVVHIIGTKVNLKEFHIPPTVKIIQHGKLKREDFFSLLRNSDIIIKMSLVEGMYGPPLEAFSQGSTCITTDVTGHEEYIKHMSNAVIISIGDSWGLAYWIKKLESDRNLLKNLQANAFDTALKWMLNHNPSTQYRNFLKKQIKKNNKPLTIQDFLSSKELWKEAMPRLNEESLSISLWKSRMKVFIALLRERQFARLYFKIKRTIGLYLGK